jgi:hypothetical protein
MTANLKTSSSARLSAAAYTDLQIRDASDTSARSTAPQTAHMPSAIKSPTPQPPQLAHLGITAGGGMHTALCASHDADWHTREQ